MKARPSRAARIADLIATEIDDGRLEVGARVASIRDAADHFGVARNTLVEAYDRLVATGYLNARPGSGFYVARNPRPDSSVKPEHFTDAIDTVSLLREQLNGTFSVRAGDGRAPASWMEGSQLGRYLRHRGGDHEDGDDFEYGKPQGFGPLRDSIARTLAERSIHAPSDQVLLTFGANHALDLLIRHFVEPGDTVLVETPGYYPLFGKLRLAKADIVGIHRGPDGPDPDRLDDIVRACRPKLFFLQPMAHNPTGTSLSLAAMHRILKVAERHGVFLVEDDPFADILPRATPHLAALDGLDQVIYLGTFSKTLSASLRCGYIAASPPLIQSLTDIKMLTVVSSSGVAERMVNDMILRGRYRRHLARLRGRVEQASAQAAAALREAGLTAVSGPAGGYYIWCRLPDGMNDLALARQASTRGIFLAPGSIFSLPGQDNPPALRINVAHATDRALLAFLAGELAHHTRRSP